jgi:hypothetical protein
MAYPIRVALLRLALRIAVVAIPSVIHAQNPAVTVNVDIKANRHAINPYIYGVAHANSAALSDLNSPINRYGGNNTSRYNWQVNADNRANDWYFTTTHRVGSSAMTSAHPCSFGAIGRHDRFGTPTTSTRVGSAPRSNSYPA